MRCAIYARYSDESQNPKSTADQISQCREFIAARGWCVAPQHVFSDDAVSGSVLTRSAYTALKSAAFAGAFQYIVVDDLSRLGRNAAESLHVYQELQAIGVYIAAVADGIDSATPSAKLPYYFKSITNEIFLDDLKAKIVRGLKGQVLRGYSAGGRVYGYDTKPDWIEPEQYDKFGRRRRHGVRVVINPVEASVVVRIFNLYAQGIGYRHIASTLNAEQIESPHSGCGHRSGYWQSSTVRVMLKQPKYVGDWTWNRTRWNKKNSTGKRLSRLNPSSNWVQHHSEDLRIITPTLWQQVQKRLATSRAHKSPGKRGQRFILSGLLTCAECGSKLIAIRSRGQSAYTCNRHRSGGAHACTSFARLPREEAEHQIFEQIQALVFNPDFANRSYSHFREFQAHREKPYSESPQALKRRERQLSAALQRLLKAIEDGQGSQIITERIRQREAELFELREQIAASSRRPASAPLAVSKQQFLAHFLQIGSLLKEWLAGDLHLNRDPALPRSAVVSNPSGDRLGSLTTQEPLTAVRSGANPDAAAREQLLDRVAYLNALLKRLIPTPLRVAHQFDRSTRTSAFTIDGTLSPFNLLPLSPVSLLKNSGAGT